MALPSSDASQAPADDAAGATDTSDAPAVGGWCRDCDYPLHGLTESTRCPECGRRFDPRLPGTMETRPPVGPVGRWFRRYPNVADGAGFGAWIGVVVALTSMWANVTSGTLLLCGLPVIFLAAARVRAAVRRKLIADYGLPGVLDLNDRVFRVIPWMFLAVLALTTIHFHRCPHGTAVGALGVGIAHSESGGPCQRKRDLTSKRVAGNWYVWAAM